MAELTADQSRQGELIARMRQQVTAILEARVGLKQAREVIVAQYAAGIDAGAFQGGNGDLTTDDLMAALAAFDALESILVDRDTGRPTAALAALVKLYLVSGRFYPVAGGR